LQDKSGAVSAVNFDPLPSFHLKVRLLHFRWAKLIFIIFIIYCQYCSSIILYRSLFSSQPGRPLSLVLIEINN
jgi:hypothetical protein